MKHLKILKFVQLNLFIIFLSGCGIRDSELVETINAIPDPTERGLFYVAIAIILAAIIRS